MIFLTSARVGNAIILVQLWQIHNAEQMILDDLEANPEKYEGKKLAELSDDEDYDEEHNVQYAKGVYKKRTLPLMILVSLYSVYYSGLLDYAYF